MKNVTVATADSFWDAFTELPKTTQKKTMNNIILDKIYEIEKSHNVRIIHAAESGSRAWGFAAPNADYDVRFIYVHQKEFYLRLDKTRDVIEWQQDEIFDINGWDLHKTLRLLHKSNPALFEWNKSPIIYKTTDEWMIIQEVIDEYFLLKPGLYHYLSMAKGNYREYLKTDVVKLKKYLYVIRPILACKWILSKKCPPPVSFTELIKDELEPEMFPVIEDLLKQKTNSPEKSLINRIDKLNEYIDENLSSLKMTVDSLPGDYKPKWTQLNEIFLNIVLNDDLKNKDNTL
jgi:predicted nucleotidyltransferase